ncbi:MAG: tRNA (adenosine(37)-N6)-threonylcarbamoyltransferase complex dimerization subunit type 1 TsaB [Ignavibacteriae bacterium]|nr:MAG: tRNA (adenosine(37)-N6)-threonylcarbamoyltransferase complex dimerization subunit type 1 TsaB [Ignavibacteriota bacterium]
MNKPILAIETSETQCGTTIYFSDEKHFSSTINLKHSHSEKLFESVEYLFKTTEIEATELDSIAVSEGPGSFTGLRIGMSAAKGIAYGASIPIIPVPTFEALAYQLSQILPQGTNFAIANKVNKDEVYFAKFTITSDSYIFADKLNILKLEDLKKNIKGTKVFGNALKMVNGETETGNHFTFSPDPLYIAKWAERFGQERKIINYDYLEPNYLKNFIVKERKA